MLSVYLFFIIVWNIFIVCDVFVYCGIRVVWYLYWFICSKGDYLKGKWEYGFGMLDFYNIFKG